jgi:GT2 family glycosyltransferase
VISIVVVTHNRVHLLRRCVEDVLQRTSPSTREIVIWNNASQDGTQEYLEGLSEPRLRVVHSPENIGQNAYARAFALATEAYLIEIDDDVIEAPDRWDETLLDAFRRLPEVGFLGAALVDDPNDTASQYFKYLRDERGAYTRREINGVAVLDGPTGGGCAMTSRELYERVGGFGENKKLVYWHEDAAYVKKLDRIGYRSVVLADLHVWHAGGPYYSKVSPAKLEYHRQAWELRSRKDRVKRILLRIPGFAVLNAHYDWFEPPFTYVPPTVERFEDRADSGADAWSGR